MKKLFDQSRVRMLFALVAGVLFLFLQTIFPDLPFTEEQTIAFFGLIAAYLIGEGLEGERIRDNFKAMLMSWKFRSLAAGILLIVIKAFWADAPLSEEQLISLLEIISALIVGVGASGAVGRLSQRG